MKQCNIQQFVKVKIAFAVIAAMTACSAVDQSIQSDQTSAATSPVVLPAAEQPQEFVTGTEFHWISDGKEIVSKVVAVKDGVTTSQLENGCEWTYPSWTFAPLLGWKDCNGSSVSREISESNGSPWPMQVGNSWSHSYTSFPDSGDPVRLIHRCEVNTAELVSVPAGEFKAFKIDCEDKSVTKSYWYTDEHAAGIVKSVVTRNKTKSISELIKVIPVQ